MDSEPGLDRKPSHIMIPPQQPKPMNGARSNFDNMNIPIEEREGWPVLEGMIDEIMKKVPR